MQLTRQLLTEVLGQQGHLPIGVVKSVRKVQRFEGYADAIVRLELTFHGSPQQTTILAKIFGPT